ncbi:SusC/RagA family TonB-linked outer membrane protein [Proteiniphilum sp. UBA5384]|uniref:SusC/RagA family TonB-linked outer membrane protein n=1 Tax=Proteiniphilum sp. UBA5384 TaxID=1947279 RepID=UPI0026004BC5|nr:SusC/RagA family TonB-linked outer membrane protein [Proteiniphilum sp. UBA5384]
MQQKYSHIFLLVLFFITTGTVLQAQPDTQDSLIYENGDKLPLGYNRTIPKWMVTSAASTLSFDDFDNSFGTNLGNKLSGKLAGLTVLQKNYEPGLDSPELLSRGLGTFYGAGNNILVVVDGFQSFYEQLVPEEIASITLLKDAASTTMYGMKGANGVLLITTKRGKNGPLKVNFSMQQGFSKPNRLPDFLGAYDHARLYNEALFNDGQPIRYSDTDLEAYRGGSDPFFYPDVDWHKTLLRSWVPVSKYNLTLSGGQNSTNYFVLLSVINNAGLYEKTDKKSDFSSNSTFTQYNVRANVDIDITKRLSASTKLGFTVADKKNPADYSTDALFSLMSTIPPNAFPVYNPNKTYGGSARFSNPWGDIIESGYFTTNQRTAQVSLMLTHQLDMITRGLSVSAAVSFNNSFMGYSAKSRTYERFSVSRGSDNRLNYTKFGEETALTASEDEFNQWRNHTVQTFLQYNSSFSGNIIDATLGFDSDSYTQQFDQTDFKQLGVNGRATYTHQQKYIGELTFGYYGSNAFKKNKRFGLFPGVSLGWVVSNEEFLKDIRYLDFLKLRTSYGISGINLLGDQRFMYDQYYSSQGPYIFGNTTVQGYADSYLANPDLTWEKKREINIGIDALLWDNFDFSMDVFNQLRYDIMSVPNSEIPLYAGIVYPYWNIGEVKNRGFEAQLGYKKALSDDLTLSANFNLWYAKSEVTSIPEIIKEDGYQLQKGKPVYQPFLLEAIGFFRDDEDIRDSPLQTFGPVQPGDIKYKDQNNDGVIDDRDYYPVGYTNIPQLSAGITLGVVYKNVFMNMFIQGVTNRSVILPSYFHAFQDEGKAPSMALGRWTEKTRDTATYPRLSSYNNQNNHQVSSSFWQRDGSFIKLRNIELGYNIPGSMMRKIGLTSGNLFVNGTNIFTWDRVDIADPEVLSGYPAMRTFSVGVKVEL